MTDDDFVSVIEANLISAYRLAKRAIKPMMKKMAGHIDIFSGGLYETVWRQNYAASKSGLVGFGRSLAKEFASRNITTNIVAPGPIRAV